MTDKITFLGYQKPALESRDYTITLKQVITWPAEQTFEIQKTFSVAGERFNLAPTMIGGMFPPDGSIGDHSHALPHILLNRSSLPWERKPYLDDTAEGPSPWLVLLLFDAAEAPAPRVIQLSEVHQNTPEGESTYFPTTSLEKAQKENDQITVIDVSKDLVERLLPKYDDLKFLTHIRRDGTQGKDGTAVVIGSRLPKEGSESIAHLISIEGRYYKNDAQQIVFDAGNAATIRFVSLASWRFACLDKGKTFAQMTSKLALNSGSIASLPGNEPAATYLKMGYIPIRHILRNGDRTIGWYRGPFITGQSTDAPLPTPVQHSDSLLRYDPNTGMFDVSYAAAWELGRLLALQSVSFAVPLYDLKQRRKQHNHKQRLGESLPAYALKSQEISNEWPDAVIKWLSDLSLLRGVPFQYLLPEERLLPPESITLFWIDLNWIRALIDGAYSLGRITQHDVEEDMEHDPLVVVGSNLLPLARTGVLIRSEIISGYAGLMVDAYRNCEPNFSNTPPDELLNALRTERLAPNVMLRLFASDQTGQKSELKRLDIHQQPEAMHFGFILESNKLSLVLNNDSKNTIAVGNLADSRVLNLPDIIEKIRIGLGLSQDQEIDASQFAMQMVEIAERVSFVVANRDEYS